MKKNEFRTLLNFFMAIILIVLLEIALRPLLEGVLLPSLWRAYGVSITSSIRLRHVQLFMLESGGILMVLLWLISWVLPGPLRQLVLSAGRGLEQMIETIVPGVSLQLFDRTLGSRDALVVFLLSILLLFLQLLPYLIAGIYFVFYVVRESRRIRHAEALRQQALDAERNLLLSDIAHDIRNPITTISGYAQALDDGMVRDPKKQAEYLRAIRKKANRVEQLISILFDYAKLNSSGFQLQEMRFDFSEFLRQTAAQLYSDAEEAGMELIPEIPNPAFWLSGDRLQLSRVLNNLVSNSIRYNPAGTRILIRFDIGQDVLEDAMLVIADSGNEIDPDTASRLFEPFSRGDTSRPTDGGSGLGLSIAKSIVELHGWSISYTTEIKDYTKGFVIRIPKNSVGKYDS